MIQPVIQTRTNTFTDWEPFGGAEITEDGLFVIPDTAEIDAGFSLGEYQALEDAYPMVFTGEGSIVVTVWGTDSKALDIYFKFAQTTDIDPENDFVSETTIPSGDTSSYVINVPSQDINFDTLTMHITNNDTGNYIGEGISGGLMSKVSQQRMMQDILAIDFDGSKGQDNNQEILQLMMTPIFIFGIPITLK